MLNPVEDPKCDENWPAEVEDEGTPQPKRLINEEALNALSQGSANYLNQHPGVPRKIFKGAAKYFRKISCTIC